VDIYYTLCERLIDKRKSFSQRVSYVLQNLWEDFEDFSQYGKIFIGILFCPHHHLLNLAAQQQCHPHSYIIGQRKEDLRNLRLNPKK
jgi:hypothetical protein